MTERALRRAAAEHALAPADVDQAEAATRRFESAARDLKPQQREHARQADAVADSRDRLDRAAEEERAAAETHRSAAPPSRRGRRQAAGAAGLRRRRGPAGPRADRARPNPASAAAQAEEKTAREAEIAAIRAAAAAAERVVKGREALAVALSEEVAAARGLAPFAARELLDVLGCPPGLAWPATQEEWAGGETPRTVLDSL